MLEIETGLGYERPQLDLHKDPKLVNQIPQPETDPLANARLANIIDQIQSADLETFDDILGKLIEALQNKPELQSNPDFKAKFDAAVTRLQNITSTKH